MEVNLYIDQGIDYATIVTITDNKGVPVNLSNATINSQVRRSYTSPTAFPFTITVLDMINGVVQLSMTHEQTALMRPGFYVYDAQYSIDNFVTRFLKGMVTVNPQVTRVTPFIQTVPATTV